MINKKLEKFKKEIKGKKVAVLGIGISNVPVIKSLVKLGALVSARDKKENISDEIKSLEKIGVKFVLGDKYLDGLENYDYIFRSPSARPDKPEFLAEIERGAVLTTEIEQVINKRMREALGNED